MNNADKLRRLKKEHELTTDDIAEKLGVSAYTVKSWLLHEESEAHRVMKDRDMEFLRIKLEKP